MGLLRFKADPMATAATSTSTAPRHYVWWFPGSPVRVHVDLSVIEGLQERLQHAGLGKTEEGLLFGRVQEGATEVLKFRPASGRSVPEMIAEFAAERGKLLLVGYYRTGEALRLHENDLALFQTSFGKPYQVFLLMQPNGFAPPNASFFFSRGDQKMSEFPFLEFPLDASLLASEERDRLSRCQQATQQPIAVPRPLPSQPDKPAKKGRILSRIAVGLFVVAAALLAALWITNPSFRERSSRVWSGIRSAFRNPPQPVVQPPAPAPSHPRLGLQARTQDHDLQLTWDRESPSIAAATSGSLSIEDGPLKREISLDAQQLRGESILYSPKSDQVLIQLTVNTPTGAVTESFRVIRTAPASTPANPSVKPQWTPVVQASKPFTAPPAAKNTPSPAPLDEPPALSGSPDHPASPVSSFAAGRIVAPPRPIPGASTTPAPIPPPASPAPYHPPVALTKVTPVFPAELRSLAFKPTIVAIQVAIDKNGKVVKAKPLPQERAHKLFVINAVHAAESWKFQPARRGDEPVASEYVLRFTFSQ